MAGYPGGTGAFGLCRQRFPAPAVWDGGHPLQEEWSYIVRIGRTARRALMVAVAAAALASAPPLAPASLAAGPAAARGGVVWMISAQSLSRLAAQPGAKALIRRFFSSPEHSILVDRADGSAPALTALRSASFPSVRPLIAELRDKPGGDGSRPLQVVVLDLEDWPQTPRLERLHPVYYYRMAGRAARAHGITLAATPSPNLAQALGKGRGPVYERFLQSGMIGQIARSAAIFEVQAQGVERSPARYARFVRLAAAQARKANPEVLVIAGLSTNPGGRKVPSSLLYRDVMAARPFVDGFWLNIPARSDACPRCGVPQPQEAIGLLRRLSRSAVLVPGAPLPLAARG